MGNIGLPVQTLQGTVLDIKVSNKKSISVSEASRSVKDFHLDDWQTFGTQSKTHLGTFIEKHVHYIPSNMMSILGQLDITVTAPCWVRIQITFANSYLQTGMYGTRDIFCEAFKTVQLSYPELELPGGCLALVSYALPSNRLTGLTGGGGTGFTNGTFNLSITGGGGAGAAASVTIAGGVVGVPVITSQGYGYTSNPAVSLPGGAGAGTGATFAPIISGGSSIVPDIVIGMGSTMYSKGDEFSEIEIFGDSITWYLAGASQTSGITGTTSGNVQIQAASFEYWSTILRTFLEDKCNTVLGEPVTRSHGGGRSDTMRNFMRTLPPNGKKLTILSLGMNDAVVSGGNPNVTVANYVLNYKNMIAQIRRVNPAGTILICAPSQTDDANRSTLPAYRTALQAMFTGDYAGNMVNIGGGINGFSNSQKLIYIDLSTAYASNSTTAFSDSAPKIHPNPLGHSLLAGVITPVFDACPWNIF